MDIKAEIKYKTSLRDQAKCFKPYDQRLIDSYDRDIERLKDKR